MKELLIKMSNEQLEKHYQIALKVSKDPMYSPDMRMKQRKVAAEVLREIESRAQVEGVEYKVTTGKVVIFE